MKTVAVYPFPSEKDSNTYVKMILEHAKAENLKFVPFDNSIEQVLRMNRKEVQMIYLNWYENFESASLQVTMRRMVKRWIILQLLDIKRIAIATTVHNRQTHDTKWGKYAKLFTRHLYKQAKTLLILCEETKTALKETYGEPFFLKELKDKCVKIPHPTYTGVYPKSDRNIRKANDIAETDMVMLYLGAVKRYKNLELILQLADHFQKTGKKARFIVAGGCSDQQYLEQIQGKTKKLHNLILVPHFIGDQEIDAYMLAADIFICPLNIKSSLNSGSCMLGLTYGKQVICPKIGTIKEINYDLPYTYVYQTQEQHYQELEKATDQAYTDFMKDQGQYRGKEIQCREYMESNFSPAIIGKKYHDFFMKEDN